MRSLALNESIKTTEAKAKSIKGEFERHITRAKDGESSRYHLLKHLPEDAVDRLVNDIAPRMKDRPGGYLRIIRLGARMKDSAEMVVLELVEKGESVSQSKKVNSKKQKKTTQKVEKASISNVTAKTGDKKQTAKPLANIKQMVTRQKKGQA
jgi:large subunit ribosomal protein L17